MNIHDYPIFLILCHLDETTPEKQVLHILQVAAIITNEVFDSAEYVVFVVVLSEEISINRSMFEVSLWQSFIFCIN